MRRRDFNKRIEIYSVEPTADGFGGFTTTYTLVDTRWAKVEPLNAGTVLNEYGLDSPQRSVRFTIRKNNLDISQDYFVKYRDLSYKITSSPVELGFKNKFIEFIGQEVVEKINVQQELSETFFESGFYEAGFYEGATG